jgi:hypothetical protein
MEVHIKRDDDSISMDNNLHPRKEYKNCRFCNKTGHMSSMTSDILCGIAQTGCQSQKDFLCNLRNILMKKKPCRLSRTHFLHLETCGRINIDDFFIRFHFGKYNVDSILRSVSIDLTSIPIDFRQILIDNSKSILREIETFERRKVVVVFNQKKMDYLHDLCVYIIDFFEKKQFDITLNDDETEMLVRIYQRTPKPNKDIWDVKMRKRNERNNISSIRRKNDPIILPLSQMQSASFIDEICIPFSVKKVYLEYQCPDRTTDISINVIHICVLSELSAELIFCGNKDTKEYEGHRPETEILGPISEILVLDNVFNFTNIRRDLKVAYYGGYRWIKEKTIPYSLERHTNLCEIKPKANLTRKQIRLKALKKANSLHQKN